MIVEEITLRNWRRYRDPHTFRFGEGLNLLVGRNEAGKSTLFEALQRGLFDRHNGQASEIKAIQPLDSSLGPEVEIVLRSGGQRYRVVKRFLQDATAELHAERGGAWELDHEGDKADERIRELFEGDVPGRGATKVEHRGLAQALWYLQGEASIPEASWNDAVEKGLQGLVEVVAATPREERLVEAIQAAYDEHWTPTGWVSSKSEMAELDEEIPKLEETLSEVRATLEKADAHREALESFRAQQATKAEELETAREELDELDEAVEQAEELEDEREELEARVEEARDAFGSVDEDLERLDELDEDISALETAVEEAEEELAERRLEAKEAKRDAERLDERWKQEHEPELKGVEQELQAVQAVERRDTLQDRAERLEDHLDELEDRQAALEEAQEALQELHAPDEETITRVQAVSSELEVARAKAQASAIRVRFDLAEAPPISADPEAEEDAGDYLVTRPTTFQLGELGEVHVRGGGETLEELQATASKLQAQRQEILDRYDAEDLQDLQDLHHEHRDLEAEVQRRADRVDDLADREEAPREELQAIRSQLKDLDVPAGELDLDGEAPAERRQALEERKAELIATIETTRDDAEEAKQTHLRLIERAQKVENRATEKRAELKSKRDRKAEIIARYGTRDQLEEVHQQREQTLASAEEDLEDFLEDYEAQVERPRKLHAQAQRRVEQLTEDLDELEREIDVRLAKIEQITEEDPYARAADLEATLERLQERRAVVEVRSQAAKLLYHLVEAHQQARSQALAGPVAKTVDRWLKVLTEDSYDRLRLDENLVPEAVETPRYEEDLPLTELSYGTQEQVVVLLRLAMAVLLSETERQLVILDDRLVNADPVRMKRLGLILDEATEACQVLMATCDDTPYAGVEGRRIHVPTDGREET